MEVWRTSMPITTTSKSRSIFSLTLVSQQRNRGGQWDELEKKRKNKVQNRRTQMSTIRQNVEFSLISFNCFFRLIKNTNHLRSIWVAAAGIMGNHYLRRGTKFGKYVGCV
jgi:hypothetical protein